MVKTIEYNDPQGSIWRKWDLHVHTPYTKLNNNYKSEDVDVWDKFCQVIENSDVEVIGITDYFSVDNYFIFIEKFTKKYPNSRKKFFLNIELRLNESVNSELEEVNIHLIFNSSSIDKVNKFLNQLRTVKTGKDEIPLVCSDLIADSDFKSATVTRTNITSAFEATYGKKAIRQDHFLVFTAANNDGIRPMRGKQRKEIITDEIDKFTDAFFGSIQNTDHFLITHRLEDKEILIAKKPVVTGSDARSFDELNKYLGRRVIEEKDNKEKIIKDVTWIKADPTFEGLKQILYEPESGERVTIGPIKPDYKDDYKVIQKILFANDTDFPEEVLLNRSLCSIIGSRSSGKSALLAYLAHSIDKELTEKLIKGPGEGEKYYWSKINPSHSIVWANGKTNDDSPGKIVYIPQNYLFDKSKDADEIKEKIEPVLFKLLPDFKADYLKTQELIDTENINIQNEVDKWFDLSETIRSFGEELRTLGDKNAIEKEKEEITSKINELKTKYQLSDENIKQYQKTSAQISVNRNRIEAIETELTQLNVISKGQNYFNNVKISLFPALDKLPKILQDKLSSMIKNEQVRILEEVNTKVLEYKILTEDEKVKIENNIATIKEENKPIIEKHNKNIELDDLVKKLNRYSQLLELIKEKELEQNNKNKERALCEENIKSSVDNRKLLINELVKSIGLADQSALEGINFGIEYGFGNNLIELTQKINIKENSQFVKGGEFYIEKVREKPGDFLQSLYSGKQKIIAHNDRKEVARQSLSLTEKTLFTAEMEGDKIGGFSEPTMTAGKRALFALRLILAESNDTWPLLIDQPEDDLDSRSIYDEVVPFLKDKKKERQIIMVSHNANLVIGADSEQIIVANRNGDDRKNENGKQFNYLTGSIEYSHEKDEHCKDVLKSQGIREHTCDILDGGKVAFEQRRNKYNLTKM